MSSTANHRVTCKVHEALSHLQANAIAYHQIRLREPRERREYCVQYNETSYDFIHRLVAEESLFYYFECKGQYALCIGDAVVRVN